MSAAVKKPITSSEFEEYKNKLIDKYDRKLTKKLDKFTIEEPEAPTKKQSLIGRQTVPKSVKVEVDTEEEEETPILSAMNPPERRETAKKQVPTNKDNLVERTKVSNVIPDKKVTKTVRGKKVEKEYISNQTKGWAAFRSQEYQKYKAQVGATGNYTQFLKLAGLVWSALSTEEKNICCEKGWNGDWSKISK